MLGKRHQKAAALQRKLNAARCQRAEAQNDLPTADGSHERGNWEYATSNRYVFAEEEKEEEEEEEEQEERNQKHLLTSHRPARPSASNGYQAATTAVERPKTRQWSSSTVKKASAASDSSVWVSVGGAKSTAKPVKLKTAAPSGSGHVIVRNDHRTTTAAYVKTSGPADRPKYGGS